MKDMIVILCIGILSLGLTIKEEAPTLITDNVVMCSGSVVKGMVYERNDEMEKAGKCYGYVNCTACRNCSSCKHCNSGGSCGVCSGSGSRGYFFSPKKKTTSSYSTWKSSSSTTKKKYKSTSTYKPKKSYSTETKTRVRTSNTSSYTGSSTSSYTNTTRLYANKDYYVKADIVNVRTGPSIKDKVKAKVKYGDRVTATERTEEKAYISKYGNHYWYYVDYYGGTGWIYGGLLKESNNTEGEDKEVKVVTGNDVNVRHKPGMTTGNKLFKLQLNDKVNLLGPKKNYEKIGKYGFNYWYKIRSSKGDGWIYGGLIK